MTSTSPARSLSELKFHEAMRKKCQRLAARHRRKQLLPLTHKFSRRFSQKRVGVSSGWKKAFKEGARSEPYLRTLTRRKRSLLYRIGVKHFPEHKARAVDLSQNFNFTELAPSPAQESVASSHPRSHPESENFQKGVSVRRPEKVRAPTPGSLTWVRGLEALLNSGR